MKKTSINPEKTLHQGEEDKQDERTKVSKYDEVFMQILRSQRLSLREIGKLAGFCPATVSKYTEDKRFPQGTDLNISIVIRQLLMKAAIDAWIDKGINGREYALTIEKYIGALKGIEDLRMDISRRDEILVLEKIMQEEYAVLSGDMLEILQARYDKLNEELKG